MEERTLLLLLNAKISIFGPIAENVKPVEIFYTPIVVSSLLFMIPYTQFSHWRCSFKRD